MSKMYITITLIDTVRAEPNKNGFASTIEGQSRLIPCELISIGTTEFYRAQQAGIMADQKVKMRIMDYHGEELAELNGKRYQVVRTYLTGGEWIEITLSDLSEGGEKHG